MFRKGLQLQTVKGILATSNVLHGILTAAALTSHAVEGLGENLRGHAMLVLQDQTLLQSH